MRSEQEANRAIELYADTIKRLCMIYLKSYSDTEDIFQNVFIKYIVNTISFDSDEHEKAWFIRITINECKDFLKNFFRSRCVPIDEIKELTSVPEAHCSDVLNAVMTLPEKYKAVVYLHYYEGYSAVDIGEMLHKNVNTIYTRLARARRILKERLGDDFEQNT